MKPNYQRPVRAVKHWDTWIADHRLGDIAVAAEQAGFDMVSMTDHPFPYEPWHKSGGHHAFDPFVALAFLAAPGVGVRLSSALDADAIAALHPDVVVLATGGQPAPGAFTGADDPAVVTVDDVLTGAVTPGPKVAVVAGLEDHLRPVTAVDLLRSRGHEVTLIGEPMTIGQGIERRTLHQLLKRLVNADVVLRPMTAVTAFHDGVLSVRHVITDRTDTLGPVDTVVVACGSTAVDGLRAPLRASGVELHLVGDCLGPRQVINAILDGTRVGRAV